MIFMTKYDDHTICKKSDTHQTQLYRVIEISIFFRVDAFVITATMIRLITLKKWNAICDSVTTKLAKYYIDHGLLEKTI